MSSRVVSLTYCVRAIPSPRRAGSSGSISSGYNKSHAQVMLSLYKLHCRSETVVAGARPGARPDGGVGVRRAVTWQPGRAAADE
eukprot:4092655-Pleurochrysis_carterae.AAC.6